MYVDPISMFFTRWKPYHIFTVHLKKRKRVTSCILVSITNTLQKYQQKYLLHHFLPRASLDTSSGLGISPGWYSNALFLFAGRPRFAFIAEVVDNLLSHLGRCRAEAIFVVLLYLLLHTIVQTNFRNHHSLVIIVSHHVHHGLVRLTIILGAHNLAFSNPHFRHLQRIRVMMISTAQTGQDHQVSL